MIDTWHRARGRALIARARRMRQIGDRTEAARALLEANACRRVAIAKEHEGADALCKTASEFDDLFPPGT